MKHCAENKGFCAFCWVGFHIRTLLRLFPVLSFLVLFFADCFFAHSVCFGQSAAGSTPKQVLSVVQIRFGQIDPPVVAQSDITVRAATSNQQAGDAPLECSGMVWLDGSLIITSDRHQHCLFVCPIDLTAMTIGRPQATVIIRNEQDLLDDAESITLKLRPNGTARLYVMCSMSNNPAELPLPMRQHVLRAEIHDTRRLAFSNVSVISGSSIRNALNEHFRAVGMDPYRTYYADFSGSNKNTYRWANIEGICFVPNSSLLLCGFRNPLLEEQALIAVIDGIDEAFDTQDSGRLGVEDLFVLDLGGRGVSDIAWDVVTGGYLIAAAKSNGPWLDKNQPFPPNQLDEALFWWSGHKSDKPILFAQVYDMKIEAVCRLGNSRFIAIASDEGDVS
ncbi:MAG TPA: hypothetical protein PKV53_12330, partial [Anaerohalosphaeraceae bacterium]|nr:hypothetical protein [Anaerohalosphaeraceae bacterium]